MRENVWNSSNPISAMTMATANTNICIRWMRVATRPCAAGQVDYMKRVVIQTFLSISRPIRKNLTSKTNYGLKIDRRDYERSLDWPYPPCRYSGCPIADGTLITSGPHTLLTLSCLFNWSICLLNWLCQGCKTHVWNINPAEDKAKFTKGTWRLNLSTILENMLYIH